MTKIAIVFNFNSKIVRNKVTLHLVGALLMLSRLDMSILRFSLNWSDSVNTIKSKVEIIVSYLESKFDARKPNVVSTFSTLIVKSCW